MLRLVLAARGAVQENAQREAGKFATCWLGAERTSLVVEAWVGSSAELRLAEGGTTRRLVGRPSSGNPVSEEHFSWVPHRLLDVCRATKPSCIAKKSREL